MEFVHFLDVGIFFIILGMGLLLQSLKSNTTWIKTRHWKILIFIGAILVAVETFSKIMN